MNENTKVRQTAACELYSVRLRGSINPCECQHVLKGSISRTWDRLQCLHGPYLDRAMDNNKKIQDTAPEREIYDDSTRLTFSFLRRKWCCAYIEGSIELLQFLKIFLPLQPRPSFPEWGERKCWIVSFFPLTQEWQQKINLLLKEV